ncbi:urease accessory protein UreD [Kitasatospora sp. NPDC054939]
MTPTGESAPPVSESAVSASPVSPSPASEPPASESAVSAPPVTAPPAHHTRITAAPDGRGGTALPVLAGAGPLAPRRTRAEHPGTARVLLVGTMAGPLGGDRIAITVRVEPGAALAVGSAAATVSLPGPGTAPGPARLDIHLTVGDGARLDWHPEPVIAASDSHLVLHTRITLAAGALLRHREEQVLGRHHDWARGAAPGRLTSRLTVRQAGRLLLDQQTDLGPGAPAWDGPAVLGGHRSTGQLLTVGHPPAPSGHPVPEAAEAALLTLPGPDATLLTALAPDALTLRQALGPGW